MRQEGSLPQRGTAARLQAPRAAVFLDRDGVLNDVRLDGQVARTPRDADEVRIVAGAADALQRLRSAGFVLLVVTNQPDVARGEISADAVERINGRLRQTLPVDDIYCCLHDNRDGCYCRKPSPGLILAGAREWEVDLDRSCLVGDRWTDVAAAAAAGIDAILLEAEHSWRPTSIGPPPRSLRPRHVARSLGECVDFILRSPKYGPPGGGDVPSRPAAPNPPILSIGRPDIVGSRRTPPSPAEEAP